MKIKTFPLQFTEEDLKKIRDVAASMGMTMKDFIHSAIREKIERGE